MSIAYWPNDSLDQIAEHLRVHVPRLGQAGVHNVVASSTVVVSTAVTLLTVTYRVVAIVASTLCCEADGYHTLVCGAAVLHQHKQSDK